MSALSGARTPDWPFPWCCGGHNMGNAEYRHQHSFGRCTGAPPGIGWLGQAFVDALRPLVGGRSVGVYAVNYPATYDFSNSASAGASDASAHVQYMAVNCPSTRM